MAVIMEAMSGRTFIEKGAELIHLDPQKAAEGWMNASESLRACVSTKRRLSLMPRMSRRANINGPASPGLPHSRKADGQSIFDAIGAQEKELFWIEESNQRFYAYNYFGQHPERLIGWFDKHMGGTAQSQHPQTAEAQLV